MLISFVLAAAHVKDKLGMNQSGHKSFFSCICATSQPCNAATDISVKHPRANEPQGRPQGTKRPFKSDIKWKHIFTSCLMISWFTRFPPAAVNDYCIVHIMANSVFTQHASEKGNYNSIFDVPVSLNALTPHALFCR